MNMFIQKNWITQKITFYASGEKLRFATLAWFGRDDLHTGFYKE